VAKVIVCRERKVPSDRNSTGTSVTQGRRNNVDMILNCDKANAEGKKFCDLEYDYFENEFLCIQDTSVNVKT
jgi:hypothetical protein